MFGLRSAILSISICHLALPAQAATYDLPPRTRLESELLHAGEVVAPGISRIVAAGRDTVVVLENRPARLVRVLPDGRNEILIGIGSAPWEIDAPECRMSRPRSRAERLGCGAIVLHALREPRSVEWAPGGRVVPIRSDRIITSFVARPDGVLATLFTSSSPEHGVLLGGTEQLGWFSSTSSGEELTKWTHEQGYFPFDYSDNAALDVARSYFARLLPRDERTCYWVHGFAEGGVKVVSDKGTLLERFDVPRGELDALLDESLPEVARHHVLADVAVDGAGRLHALRGLYANDAGKLEKANEVLVYDLEGRIVERYRLGVQLIAFDLELDEGSYVGVDARTMDVLRFPIPESDR